MWLVAPNVSGPALPFLILLACPLSMLLMMRGMREGQSALQNEQPSWHMSDVPDVREQQLAMWRAQQETIAREITLLELSCEPQRSNGAIGVSTSVEESPQRA